MILFGQESELVTVVNQLHQLSIERERATQVLFYIIILSIIAKLILFTGLGYFFVQTKRWRDEDMKRAAEREAEAVLDRGQAKMDRDAAQAMREEIAKLLLLIQGWTIVAAKTADANKVELTKQSKHINDKLDMETPAAVADEVQKRLEQKDAHSTPEQP